MKKLTKILMTCFFLTVALTSVKAQTNEQLDEIRDLCTDLIALSSQTSSDAHRIIVFTNNANANQLNRAVEDTGEGMEGVGAGLDQLRRIGGGIISNQYGSSYHAYRSESGRLSNDLGGNTRLPREKAEVAGDIMPLMDLIKNLSQEIRAEVMAMKNSSN
jgi:hypothetical protein